ncbi:MAG: excinuclease ABC subunit UvrC [Selenomonadales bacterium]|nr:excinuclease ABC subunit UvrC [Selenomonadales bacterium]
MTRIRRRMGISGSVSITKKRIFATAFVHFRVLRFARWGMWISVVTSILALTEAAEDFRFEEAARLRDQLVAVKKVQEKQNIVTGSGDQDVIGMARLPKSVCVQVFFIRSGKMVGCDHYLLRGSDEEEDSAILTAFLKQYYARAAFIPREILLPFVSEETELLTQFLSAKKEAKVMLHVPQRGTKKDIVTMACDNARLVLEEEEKKRLPEQSEDDDVVEELRHHLGLAKPPYRMECFDISHTQGTETVASMVVFEGGRAKKSDYRKFRLRTVEGKPDDFRSMEEVVLRRYRELKEPLPDLIVIDGGKGQLSSALKVIRGVGLTDVPVVGLAKQFEYVFREGESDPVILPRHSQSLYLMQQIRDEAHRFAITYHRKLRAKRNMQSVLDHIVGIGPKRRQALWKAFGSIDAMRSASVEELAEADGMNHAAAQAVYDFFRAHEI